jgi:hypothetical protein
MRGSAGMLLPAGLSVVLGLVLVAGCTDEARPGTLKTPSPTTTSSASPTPTSVEAQIDSAVRAYFAELTRAARAGDTGKLRGMVAKECPCFRSVKVIDRNSRQGYVTPDASFAVTTVRVHDVEGQLGLAEVKTDEAAYDVLNSASKVIGHVKPRENFLDLTLAQRPTGQWVLVNEFDLLGDP